MLGGDILFKGLHAITAAVAAAGLRSCYLAHLKFLHITAEAWHPLSGRRSGRSFALQQLLQLYIVCWHVVAGLPAAQHS